MVNKKIKNYIVAAYAGGKTKDEIYLALLSTGWFIGNC